MKKSSKRTNPKHINCVSHRSTDEHAINLQTRNYYQSELQPSTSTRKYYLPEFQLTTPTRSYHQSRLQLITSTRSYHHQSKLQLTTSTRSYHLSEFQFTRSMRKYHLPEFELSTPTRSYHQPRLQLTTSTRKYHLPEFQLTTPTRSYHQSNLQLDTPTRSYHQSRLQFNTSTRSYRQSKLQLTTSTRSYHQSNIQLTTSTRSYHPSKLQLTTATRSYHQSNFQLTTLTRSNSVLLGSSAWLKSQVRVGRHVDIQQLQMRLLAPANKGITLVEIPQDVPFPHAVEYCVKNLRCHLQAGRIYFSNVLEWNTAPPGFGPAGLSVGPPAATKRPSPAAKPWWHQCAPMASPSWGGLSYYTKCETRTSVPARISASPRHHYEQDSTRLAVYSYTFVNCQHRSKAIIVTGFWGHGTKLTGPLELQAQKGLGVHWTVVPRRLDSDISAKA